MALIVSCNTKNHNSPSSNTTPVFKIADSLFAANNNGLNDITRKNINDGFKAVVLKRRSELLSNPYEFKTVQKVNRGYLISLGDDYGYKDVYSAHFAYWDMGLYYDVICLLDSTSAITLIEKKKYNITGEVLGFFDHGLRANLKDFTSKMVYTTDIELEEPRKIKMGVLMIDKAVITPASN